MCTCLGMCAPSSTILIVGCFQSSVARIPNPKFVILSGPAKFLVCKLGLCDICLGRVVAPVADIRGCRITHL